jgi:uncharacterized membrane protein
MSRDIWFIIFKKCNQVLVPFLLPRIFWTSIVGIVHKVLMKFVNLILCQFLGEVLNKVCEGSFQVFVASPG